MVSLGHFLKWFLLEAQRIFLRIDCENLVELLEVKLTEVWGPLWSGPLEFLTLRLVQQSLPTTHQLPLRLSSPGTASQGGVSLWGLLPGLWFLCVPLWASAQSALWPHFSDGSKKNCCFSRVSGFLVVGRMEWLLLNSWHADPAARSLILFLKQGFGHFYFPEHDASSSHGDRGFWVPQTSQRGPSALTGETPLSSFALQVKFQFLTRSETVVLGFIMYLKCYAPGKPTRGSSTY